MWYRECVKLTESELARFRSKYVIEGECWLWQGPLDRDGYGTFYLRGAARRAHRVAWFMINGEIPAGYVVNHTCRRRHCVNPQHLNCMTVVDNALRDSTSLGYLNSQKMYCPQGHPYDTTVEYKGRRQRVCSICDKQRRREAKRRRYAEARKLAV